MLTVACFTFNHFEENTYLVYNENNQCMIVDPGCYFEEEKQQLKQFIEDHKLNPILLVNTHCHIDHILGNDFVMQTYNLPLHLHKDELATYTGNSVFASFFGIPKPQIPENLIFIEPGNFLEVGAHKFHILFTPGHSPASLSFYEEKENIVFSGDVLFKQSIGRTDLPGGNHSLLISSIREKLFTLSEMCKVYPGHGPVTTITDEKNQNPYLR